MSIQMRYSKHIYIIHTFILPHLAIRCVWVRNTDEESWMSDLQQKGEMRCCGPAQMKEEKKKMDGPTYVRQSSPCLVLEKMAKIHIQRASSKFAATYVVPLRSSVGETKIGIRP